VAARAQDVVLLTRAPPAASVSTTSNTGSDATGGVSTFQGSASNSAGEGGERRDSFSAAPGAQRHQGGTPVSRWASASAPGAGGSSVVVATALSARHAAACAEAVRWQIGQALQAYRSQVEAGSPLAQAAAVAAPPDVAGAGTDSDWLALDTGEWAPVVVMLVVLLLYLSSKISTITAE
jgi:hypothetical protein